MYIKTPKSEIESMGYGVRSLGNGNKNIPIGQQSSHCPSQCIYPQIPMDII